MKLHIYLDYSTEQELNKIKQKYHVSLSTLADVIFNKMITSIQLVDFKYEKYKKEYLVEGKKNSTTIVINRDNKELWLYTMGLNSCDLMHLISNILYLHVRSYDDLTNNIGKDFINKKKVEINNELNNKRETFWNYNNIYRSHIRARKQYGREYGEN